jgi:hypothetical protein
VKRKVLLLLEKKERIFFISSEIWRRREIFHLFRNLEKDREKFIYHKMEEVYPWSRTLIGKDFSGSVKPLATAEQILVIAGGLGMKAVYAFTLGHEPLRCMKSMFDPKYQDELEDTLRATVTVCFNIHSYFIFWLNSEYQKGVAFTSQGNNPLTLSSLTSLPTGLYSCTFDGYESHDFIWLIQGDSLIYAGGYGGSEQMVVVNFDKMTYMNSFYRAMQGSLADYAYIFQVDPVVPSVDFQSLLLRKSITYFSDK